MKPRLASTALLCWALTSVAAAQPRAVDLRVQIEGRESAPNLARMIEVELVQLGFEVRREARSVITVRGEQEPVLVESPAGEFEVEDPYPPARAIAVAELLRAALLRDEPAEQLTEPETSEGAPARNDIEEIDPDQRVTPDSELSLAPPGRDEEENGEERETVDPSVEESPALGADGQAREAEDVSSPGESETDGEDADVEERSTWDLAVGVDAGLLTQEGPAVGASWGARARATFARWFRVEAGVEGLFAAVDGSYASGGASLAYELTPLRLVAGVGAHWRGGRWRVGAGLAVAAERVVLEGIGQGEFVGGSSTHWIPSFGVPIRASVELIGPLALTLGVEPFVRTQSLRVVTTPIDPVAAEEPVTLLGYFALRAALGLELRWPR